MADIKKIKIGETTYNIRDSRVITLTDSGSKTAGTWIAGTGSPTQNITAYSDGQLFLYKVTVAGASTTTLNIDGLGAKTIYRSGSSKLTTQYGVGSYLLLYYSSSLNSGSFIVANDSDANSDNDKKTSSGDTSSKIYLVGATTQSTYGQTTYSHDTVYVGTDGHLYDSGKQVEVKGHEHDNATASTDGFMSATDKANHDKMWNVWSADGTDETLVNKVEEVLTVFENFPEADNLVEVLSGKSKVGHTHGTSTKNAAPHSHTHSVTVSGTTGANSGTAVTALTGVKASSTDTFVKSISVGAGSLEAYPDSTSTTAESKSNGRIPFVASISSTGASANGTATVLTGVKVSGTDTFVKTVSGGSGSLAAYDAATSGTVKVSDGTRIPVITSLSKAGYTPAGSVTLTAGTAPSMNFNTGTNTDTPYISALSKSGYTPAGTIELTRGTAPSIGSATTKYLHFSAGTTPKSGATPNNTATATSSAGSGTTGATTGSTTPTFKGSAVTSGGASTTTTSSVNGSESANTGSATPTFTGTEVTSGGSTVLTSASVANGVLTITSASHTHKVTAAGTVSAHTHSYNAPKAHTHTLSHTHSVTAAGTVSEHTHTYTAPAAHTHNYDKTTSVSLTDGTAPSLTANTTSTNGIKYIEAQGTFSAGTTPVESATFTGTASTAVVTGGTTKYMKFSAGTTPKSSASFSGTNSTAVVTGGTTYYLAHSHAAASAGSTGSAATAVSGNGTATALTGVKGGTTTATIKYLEHTHTTPGITSTAAAVTAVAANGTASVAPSGHTHSYGSSTALTTTGNSGTAVAAVTEVKASTN